MQVHRVRAYRGEIKNGLFTPCVYFVSTCISIFIKSDIRKYWKKANSQAVQRVLSHFGHVTAPAKVGLPFLRINNLSQGPFALIFDI